MLWDERSKQAVEAWGSIDVLRTRGRASRFFSVAEALEASVFCFITSTRLFIEDSDHTFLYGDHWAYRRGCKMGLAFGRSNKRADCMDDSGVHATRVEWPLRVQASR